jgi:hypothetical protein
MNLKRQVMSVLQLVQESFLIYDKTLSCIRHISIMMSYPLNGLFVDEYQPIILNIVKNTEYFPTCTPSLHWKYTTNFHWCTKTKTIFFYLKTCLIWEKFSKSPRECKKVFICWYEVSCKNLNNTSKKQVNYIHRWFFYIFYKDPVAFDLGKNSDISIKLNIIVLTF